MRPAILLLLSALPLAAVDSPAPPVPIGDAITAAFASATDHEAFRLVVPKRLDLPEIPPGWRACFTVGSNHFHAGISTYALARVGDGWRWTRATYGLVKGLGAEPPTESDENVTLERADDLQACEFLASTQVAAGVLMIPLLPQPGSRRFSVSDLATINGYVWGGPLIPAAEVVSGSRAWNAGFAGSFRARLIADRLDEHLRAARWQATEPDAETARDCSAECLRVWESLRSQPDRWERECILALGGRFGDRGMWPVFAEVLDGSERPPSRWAEESDALFASRVERQERAYAHQRAAVVRAIGRLAGKTFEGADARAACLDWLAVQGRAAAP